MSKAIYVAKAEAVAGVEAQQELQHGVAAGGRWQLTHDNEGEGGGKRSETELCVALCGI